MDRETLAFSLLTEEARIEQQLFTPVELGLWVAVRNLTESFTFTDVVNRGETKNKKAVASMLRKATNMNLLRHPDQFYRRPGCPDPRVM
jgi:hypothetical protein